MMEFGDTHTYREDNQVVVALTFLTLDPTLGGLVALIFYGLLFVNTFKVALIFALYRVLIFLCLF